MNQFEHGSLRSASRPPGPCWPAVQGYQGAPPTGLSTAGIDPSRAAALCVIPAKAGGGFELTCGLARDALQTVRPQPRRC